MPKGIGYFASHVRFDSFITTLFCSGIVTQVLYHNLKLTFWWIMLIGLCMSNSNTHFRVFIELRRPSQAETSRTCVQFLWLQQQLMGCLRCVGCTENGKILSAEFSIMTKHDPSIQCSFLFHALAGYQRHWQFAAAGILFLLGFLLSSSAMYECARHLILLGVWSIIVCI